MFPLKQMFRHNNICIHITEKQMLRHNYRCSEMGARFWFCVPALMRSWHFRNAGAGTQILYRNAGTRNAKE